MKKLALISLMTLFLIFVSAFPLFAEKEEPLGTIKGEPVYTKDISLKEYMLLYEKSKSLYDLKKKYFEGYAFNELLTRLAEKDGLDTEEYLRTRIFSSIPPVTNKEVEDYIKKNRRQYKKFTYDMERLRRNIRRGLLEERKDQKQEDFMKGLFKKEKVRFNAAAIKKPKFNVSVEEDDAKLGPEKARIEIIAFLDLECPYCKRMFSTLMKVKDTFSNDLRLVFKHFPLPMHRNAFQLAREAECAGEQGFFIKYVTEIFGSGKKADCRDCREDFDEKLGMDTEAFHACLEDDTHSKSINDDVKCGKKLEITSVPVIFVNGYPIIGSVTQAKLENIIKEELESK